MRRLLTLWLTFLAAFWLTRACTSALVFGRVDHGAGETLQLLVIPALQALLVAWFTRKEAVTGRKEHRLLDSFRPEGRHREDL